MSVGKTQPQSQSDLAAVINASFANDIVILNQLGLGAAITFNLLVTA